MASAKQVVMQYSDELSDSLSVNSVISHLNSNQLSQYSAKVDLLNVTDHYKPPQVLFTPLKNVTLPDQMCDIVVHYRQSQIRRPKVMKSNTFGWLKYHQSGLVSGVMVLQPPVKPIN